MRQHKAARFPPHKYLISPSDLLLRRVSTLTTKQVAQRHYHLPDPHCPCYNAAGSGHETLGSKCQLHLRYIYTCCSCGAVHGAD